MATLTNKSYTYPTDTEYSPTSITSGRITINTADINRLILNGDIAESITNDPDNRDHKALVTGVALNDATKQLSLKIQALDPNNNFFQDNTAITLPIISATFATDDWDYSLWTVVPGISATFTSTGKYTDQLNYLRLINRPFTRKGNYFISIDVANIDSGILTAYDEGNTVLSTTRIPGTWSFIYASSSPNTATIKLSVADVLKNETVVLTSVNVYFITPRLERYLQYAVPFVLSGGSGYVTVEEVNRSIESFSMQLEDKIAQLPTFSGIALLSSHVNDRSTNPHGITIESIGAAAADHTHTLSELGAAAVDHSHTPESIGAAATNHTHSLESLHAADVNHTHTPESIGAANEVHTHSEYITENDLDVVADRTQITTTMHPALSRCTGTTIPIHGGYFPPMEIPSPILAGTSIVHRFHQTTDPIYGTAYSDTPRIMDSSAWSAFYRPMNTDTDQYYAIYSTIPTIEHPVILGYRLHTLRQIKEYTISRYMSGTMSVLSWTLTTNTGAILDTQTVSWDVDETSKSFQLPIVDEEYPSTIDLRWVFTSTSTIEDSVDPVWGVHIGIECATGSVDDRVIAQVIEDTRYTTTTIDGRRRQHMLPIGDIIGDSDVDRYDTLYVYADVADGDVKYGYSTCAPEYGRSRRGIEIFARYRPSVHRDRYGLISTLNTLDEKSSVEYVYTIPTAYDYTVYSTDTEKDIGSHILDTIDRVLTASGEKQLSIMHTEIPHMVLYGYTLYLSTTDIAEHIAPTHIQILYTREISGYTQDTLPTVDEYGHTVISGTISDGTLIYTAICSDRDVSPRYMDTIIDWTYYDDSHTEILDIPIPDVIGLTYHFINEDDRGDRIGILGIQPLSTGDFYDISTGIMYDSVHSAIGGRVYIGILSRQTLQDGRVIYYPYPSPIGTDVVLPLDVSMGEDNVELTIANPFFTTEITIHATDSNYYTFNGSIDNRKYMTLDISPSLRVKEITPDRISMIVQNGLRGVVIHRCW